MFLRHARGKLARHSGAGISTISSRVVVLRLSGMLALSTTNRPNERHCIRMLLGSREGQSARSTKAYGANKRHCLRFKSLLAPDYPRRNAGEEFQSGLAHSQTESRFETKGFEVIASRFRLVLSSIRSQPVLCAMPIAGTQPEVSFQQNAPKEGA